MFIRCRYTKNRINIFKKKQYLINKNKITKYTINEDLFDTISNELYAFIKRLVYKISVQDKQFRFWSNGTEFLASKILPYNMTN